MYIFFFLSKTIINQGLIAESVFRNAIKQGCSHIRQGKGERIHEEGGRRGRLDPEGYKLMMGFGCYDIVCKMGVGWTIIQNLNPFVNSSLFFFSLPSFDNRNRQNKKKKKAIQGSKKYDTYWFRGTGLDKKLKDRPFEPRSRRFIAQGLIWGGKTIRQQ